MSYHNFYQQNTWHFDATYDYPTQHQTLLCHPTLAINGRHYDIMGSSHQGNPNQIYGAGNPGESYIQNSRVDEDREISNTGYEIDLIRYSDSPTSYMGDFSPSTLWPTIEAPTLPYTPQPPEAPPPRVSMPNAASTTYILGPDQRWRMPHRDSHRQLRQSRSSSPQQVSTGRDVRDSRGYRRPTVDKHSDPPTDERYLMGTHVPVTRCEEPEETRRIIPDLSPGAPPSKNSDNAKNYTRKPPKSVEAQSHTSPQEPQPAFEEPSRALSEAQPALNTSVPESTPSIPLVHNINLLKDEIRRIDARNEITKAAKEREQNAEEQRFKIESLWPGDVSAYPAEATKDMQLPKCEYRARTIHVGRPKIGRSGREFINAYAFQQTGTGHINYRLARGVLSPQEIVREGRPVTFEDIRPNVFFEGMSQAKAELWIKQLLSLVPGQNDSIMKWTRDYPANSRDR